MRYRRLGKTNWQISAVSMGIRKSAWLMKLTPRIRRQGSSSRGKLFQVLQAERLPMRIGIAIVVRRVTGRRQVVGVRGSAQRGQRRRRLRDY
jgi:hypothetical protein